MGSACDHMDHTNTQLVYSLTVAVITVVFGYIPVALGVPVYIVLPVGILVNALVVMILGKSVEVQNSKKFDKAI
jgi:Na+/H+ antiporter NhaC